MRIGGWLCVAALLCAVTAGCGDSEESLATGSGGGVAEPGERPADATTTSTSTIERLDEPASTTAPTAVDGSFEAVMTNRCREVFEGVRGLDEPETVGEVRTLISEATRLHDGWLDHARTVVPPSVPADEWRAHLDRLEVALRDAEAYMAELTAGRHDSEPVEELFREMETPEALEVDHALNDVLWDLNMVLGIDCFDAVVPDEG